LKLINQNYKGISVAIAVGRITSTFVPFIIYPIYLHDKWLPYLIYALLYLVAFLIMLSYPIDLTGYELDNNVKKNIFYLFNI